MERKNLRSTQLLVCLRCCFYCVSAPSRFSRTKHFPSSLQHSLARSHTEKETSQWTAHTRHQISCSTRGKGTVVVVTTNDCCDQLDSGCNLGENDDSKWVLELRPLVKPRYLGQPWLDNATWVDLLYAYFDGNFWRHWSKVLTLGWWWWCTLQNGGILRDSDCDEFVASVTLCVCVCFDSVLCYRSRPTQTQMTSGPARVRVLRSVLVFSSTHSRRISLFCLISARQSQTLTTHKTVVEPFVIVGTGFRVEFFSLFCGCVRVCFLSSKFKFKSN